MAGPRRISLMDALFAEALAAGLARSVLSDRPPENLYVLSGNPLAWLRMQLSSKKENLVVAVEFSSPQNESSKKVRPLFVDLAREHEGMPFVRANVEPGQTFAALRKELGGIEYTPTIVIMFYGDDNTVRAKFEGIDEINDGFKKGIIKAVIENFTERRKKLKMAERLAENFASGLALHMLVGMMASSSDDEEDKKSEKITEKKKLESEAEELRKELREKEAAIRSLDRELEKMKI